MKGISDITLAVKEVSPQLVKVASAVLAACALAIAQSSPEIPEVRLDANGLSPRSIEGLTGTTIARHYAWAWRDLAGALESGQPDRLGEEFVGFAKDHLVQRVSEQRQAGVHVRIVDHGHHLKAVFYSPDGAAMQLLDQAQLEIQTYDGNKLIDARSAQHEYVILMTPGADRWYVRDLEEVSAKAF